MLNKGFIGPVGDDLPSLIPLLFGLVMFFSTFTIAFNAFDSRNAEFDNDIAVMRVSRILQSNSYIYSYKNFRELCDTIGDVNVNFVAGISEAPSKGTATDIILDVQFFGNS